MKIKIRMGCIASQGSGFSSNFSFANDNKWEVAEIGRAIDEIFRVYYADEVEACGPSDGGQDDGASATVLDWPIVPRRRPNKSA